MIKVALDISPLTGQNSFRGQGMYTRRLWEALKNFQKVEILPFSQNESVPQADLVHYPYFSPFSLTLPISLPDKFVVTVHDLIPLVFPQAYPPGIKGKLKFEIQKFNLHKAKGIITDSYSSQSDISRFTGIAKEKIEVIYLAAGNHLKRISDQEILQKVKEKFNLPPKFVLYVNDVNYNKNLPGLVRACREVGIKLVVVGKQAVEKKFNAEHIENKPLVEFNKLVQGKEDVLRLGFVEEEELAALYSLAEVFCLPSFYEGFGLQILEAMACQCPIVTSNVSSLPEVAGKAAVLIDPENIHSIAEGIDSVLKNKALREKLIKLGLEREKEFSWEQTARHTISFYESLI